MIDRVSSRWAAIRLSAILDEIAHVHGLNLSTARKRIILTSEIVRRARGWAKDGQGLCWGNIGFHEAWQTEKDDRTITRGVGLGVINDLVTVHCPLHPKYPLISSPG